MHRSTSNEGARERTTGSYLVRPPHQAGPIDVSHFSVPAAPPSLDPRARSFTPSPEVRTFTERELPHDLVAELWRSARGDEASVRATCEASFAVLLSRHLGTTDVAFTTDGAHGAGGSSGQALLRRRAHVLDETSLFDLVAALKQQAKAQPPSPTDGPGHSQAPPQSDVFALAFHRAHLSVTAAGSSGSEEAPAPSPGSDAPTSKILVDLSRGTLSFEHPGLAPAAAARTLASLEHLLSSFARDSHRLLSALQVLPPEERRRLLEAWNDTEGDPSPAETLQAAFERQVHQRPDAPAVESDGQAFTFRELDRRSNQLAHALRLRGASRGEVVGVCMERGVNLVVALLGVLKSGAAYLPLDPAYPRERLARMIRVANVSLAVTEAHLQHLVGVRSVILQQGINRSLVDMPVEHPPEAASPRDPCYVMFTSGSTGEPKGVVMTHAAVVNTLTWVNRRCAIGPQDRALFVTSPSFDLSVYDIFGVLGAGGTLVVASTALLEDPAELARAVCQRRITLWNSTPAAFEQILPFVPREGVAPELRWVLLSGDWIPLSLPEQMRARFPEACLLALGGATEAAIWSNAFSVGDVNPAWRSIPYGRPIANMRYHVLDERRHPVPVGVSGELYIGGVGLGEGYVNRPGLTSERFVLDPFRPGERLYRTGDAARYFEDGNIELLGRLDRQVKIRGFRVEMAEVEAALLGSVSVRHAVCVTHADGSGQHSLTAYVVPWPETQVVGEVVRRELGRVLPHYMVPDQVVVCERLPLSPQGKVDRRALPRPQEAAAQEYVAPRNPREAEMQALWQTLLGRDRIGVRDTFASCGGHSLLAVKLVTEIRVRMGVELSLTALIASPTIEALVSELFPPNEGIAGMAGMPGTPGRARTTATSSAPRPSSTMEVVNAATHAVSARRAPHLFALQERGSRPPLVLVAGVGGFAFTYRNFPRFFGPDQPVYAFQSVGAELGEPLEELSIEELGAIYERELLALPGEGPVVLGGFSFGILPAFELACRLQRRGRRVPLLVSLDGFAPGYPRKRPLAVRLMDHFTRLRHASAADRRDYLDARFDKLKERAFRALGKEAQLAPDLPFDDALNHRLKELWVLQRKAARAYEPSQLAQGRMLLLRAEEPEHWPGTDMDDPLYGWERHITGPVTLSTIPARHTELLVSPAHQKVTAELIARHIDAVVSAERMAPRLSEQLPAAAPVGFSAFPPMNRGIET